MSATVLAPGLLTTIQDTGRHGHAALGVGRAGAMDEPALRLANRLVGNAADAAALEITLHGPTLRFDQPTVVAWTGGDVDVRCGDRVLAGWRPHSIAAGATVVVGALHRGARSYLAFAGGIDCDVVLGSRSCDVNGGIGPDGGRALRSGDRLSFGAARPMHGIDAARWSVDPGPWFDGHVDRAIRLVAGDAFVDLDEPSRHALTESVFRIDPASNRVGFRLAGVELKLRETGDAISAGVTAGTIQLPPGGTPIVLMVEHPTTGGYARIAHVISADFARLAQRRPGDAVRFAMTDLSTARRLAREHRERLDRIEQEIAYRTGG
jgi:antagonist of KipI